MRVKCLAVPAVFSFIPIVAALAGCGGTPTTSTIPVAAVVITAQPVNQIVPIGETATFTVAATGAPPLSYQWSENGTEIPGATSASYTAPAVALGAGGSTKVGSFQASVTNPVNAVTSNAASLSVGPRSPKPGDLRYLLYEQVSLPGFMGSAGGEVTVMLGGIDPSCTGCLGIPLWYSDAWNYVGGGCAWDVNMFGLPAPMTNMGMTYQEGFFWTTPASKFVPGWLQSVAAPNVVITSMDIEPVCFQANIPNAAESGEVAVSWVDTPTNGTLGTFDQRLEVIPPAQIAAQAAAEGQASRVITAASFDELGNANLISYGWTGDTATKYESQTAVVPPAGVGAEAATLAANGYFISAFGGNDANGFILVGMRVQGDTLPRPINVNGMLAPNPITGVGPYGEAYFTPVVVLTDDACNCSVEAWEQ
jgi:hypothetical protein